jgi:hypothetical protein
VSQLTLPFSFPDNPFSGEWADLAIPAIFYQRRIEQPGAYAVITDSRGLLWAGTAFGVNWFDGEKFSVAPIESKTGQLYVTRFSGTAMMTSGC